MKLRLKPTRVTILCVVFALNYAFLSVLAPVVYPQSQDVVAEDFALWDCGYYRVNQINVLTGWVLFILLAYIIGGMINRLTFYFKARRQSLDFSSSPQLYEALLDEDLGQAMRICAEYDTSHRARVVAAGLQAWQPARGAETLSIERSRRAMQNTMEVWITEFKRGLWTFKAIIWLAPLVGICGALLNMIDTLEGMWYAEGTGIYAITNCLADALWCVMFGLGVAIPAAWAYRFLQSRAERLTSDMNDSSWMVFDNFLKWQIEQAAIDSSSETLNVKEPEAEMGEPRALWLYAR